MPKSCVAYGCSNHNLMENKLSFFKFPCKIKQKERWEKWVQATKRVNVDGSRWQPGGKYTYLCEKHFISGKPSKDRLHPDYVPSIFKHTKEKHLTKERQLKRYKERTERCLLKQRRKENVNSEKTRAIESVEIHNSVEAEQEMPKVDDMSPSTSTDMDEKTKDEEIQSLKEENYKLTIELKRITESIDLRTFDYVFLQNNDKACKYLTGLSSDTFMVVANFIKSTFLQRKQKMSIENQLFFVLLKLRLNLQFEYLSYQTGLSLSTMHDMFWRILDLILAKMGFLIQWPDREIIRQTIPPIFKNIFPRLTSIIDCFEIFIDRPKILKARAQVYSNYKKHSTVKFLIACSPLGAVTFLSSAWGGRASDREIVIDSNFINPNLHLPGDQILADRGFNLQEDFAVQCGAELLIPSYMKGRSQMSAKDVETTRKIANVRIHVERVIGLIKNRYTILKGPLSIPLIKSQSEEQYNENTLSGVDKLVRVCAILVNLSPSIVYNE